MSITSGQRPDVTPAQAIGAIPVVANMLHAFGVFDLSDEQQDSLEKTIAYAIALVGGDALLRIGRNYRDARVDSTALAAAGEPRRDIDLDEDGIPDEDDILIDEEILAEDRTADELELEEDVLPEPQQMRPAGERPDPLT